MRNLTTSVGSDDSRSSLGDDHIFSAAFRVVAGSELITKRTTDGEKSKRSDILRASLQDVKLPGIRTSMKTLPAPTKVQNLPVNVRPLMPARIHRKGLHAKVGSHYYTLDRSVVELYVSE